MVNGTQNLLDSGLPTITRVRRLCSPGHRQQLSAGPHHQHLRTVRQHVLDRAVRRFQALLPLGLPHPPRRGPPLPGRFLPRHVQLSRTSRDFAGGPGEHFHIPQRLDLAYWKRYPFDLYWQDTYKIKDNLTLNYGVRYEYPSAIYQTRQEATNFIPGVGPVLLGTNQVLTIDPTKTGPGFFCTYTQAPVTLSATAA